MGSQTLMREGWPTEEPLSAFFFRDNDRMITGPDFESYGIPN